MFDIKLALISAIVMFILEYFVLLKVYKRSKKLETISLIFAPLMIIIAQYIAHLIQSNTNIFDKTRINPLVLFLSFALLELPLAYNGYEISPNASILERVIIASGFGTVSTIIGQSIIKLL
jgi:uncharacterized membrane protein YkvI